jgi:tRNA pseudouridine65 synthase
LLVHRGWANDSVTALSQARAVAGRWVYPVHRLDRGTSGVLVFALSPEVARDVQALFEQGLVEKRYLALVRGLSPETIVVEHALSRDDGSSALPATTRVRRLSSYPVLDELTGICRRYSWVEARPEAGRTHQIRRHLKHVNHQIIGDVRYGKGQHNRLFRRRFGLARMVLHAAELSLPLPGREQPVRVCAPLPGELVSLLTALAQSPDGDGDGDPADALNHR